MASTSDAEIGLMNSSRTRGCLIGGAAGDALGAPVEFMTLATIRATFGQNGLRNYAPAYGQLGAITDDTQMTLFTAEGLIRAWVRMSSKGICNISGVIHHAYLRWLLTQGERPTSFSGQIGEDGWLFALPSLHHRRAPGNTCLSALRAAESISQPRRAANGSKGCGGVMRAAPIGLIGSMIGNDDAVFNLAAEAAALTHGHPTGFLTAGYLAVVIAAIMRGETLTGAMDHADKRLWEREHHVETAAAVAAARALAAKGPPEPEGLEILGGGWVAEEALAIALCCALTTTDFSDGIIRAANHSGDTDSTAAICGNLLGTLYGDNAISQDWRDSLELYDEISGMADDLIALADGTLNASEIWEKYPGW